MKKFFILAIMMAFVGVSADAKPRTTKAKAKAKPVLVVNDLKFKPVIMTVNEPDSIAMQINDEIIALLKEVVMCQNESEAKTEYARIEPKLMALQDKFYRRVKP